MVGFRTPIFQKLRHFVQGGLFSAEGCIVLRCAPRTPGSLITLFLCGDVMMGRGLDQILPHPSDPVLYEPHVTSALRYVELAEEATGPIPKPVDVAYIWGDAVAEWERVAPDARIINLETAVTRSNDWDDKGINYRMHPQNVACLSAAQIDCCVLANNHVLDWGATGLVETVDTLRKARITTVGAGRTRREAEAPAVLEVEGKGRILVFASGVETSGIPSFRDSLSGALLPRVTDMHMVPRFLGVHGFSAVWRERTASVAA